MDKPAVKLAPSILAADFARLGEQVAAAEQAGADRIHVDIMDGHFVPNISMGAPIVQSLRRVTRLPLELHLMIADPDFFLEQFTEAGSDAFLVHWEGNNNLHRTVHRVKALGKRVGVAIIEFCISNQDILTVAMGAWNCGGTTAASPATAGPGGYLQTGDGGDPVCPAAGC
jgi:ribulose-phosphate 3-epimerase